MKWLFGKKRMRNTSPMTIDDGLSAVMAAANESLAAANALASTNTDAFHKASLIVQYEPNRFEIDDEFSEARIARDAAVTAQDAANRLKEAALALAIALKGNGSDLSAAEFAEVGSKAMQVDWSPIYSKVDALRDAVSQALSAIEEYYAD